MPSPPPLPRRTRGFWKFLGTLGHGLNIVRLVVLNLVFFVFLLLFVILIAGGLAAKRQLDVVQADSVLLLRPVGMLVEQYSLAPLERAFQMLTDNASHEVQLRDLIAAIDGAAKDARIRRILLEPEELHGGFAAMREVGAALDRFRAEGKQVWAWGVHLEQTQYYLASHADKILIDPQGGVIVTGLANYRLFYKRLLDRLGVDVHLFRVGEFKSAAEPFVLDHASSEAKEADAYWMGGIWGSFIADVAQARKIDPVTLRAIFDGMPAKMAGVHGDLAKLSLQQHLVDGLMTPSELEKALREDGVPAGKEGTGLRQVDMGHYLAATHETPSAKPGVTVLVAEGEITPGKQPQGQVGGESTAELIRRAREEKSLHGERRMQALVLRINSPGGEVYAAEQIRREIELTREAGIPVVVSMGNVAASGGYWIAMNADRIFAEPNTITGSIGIFGLYPSVPGALDKIGVHSDGVAIGPLAGAFDMTRPLDPKVATLVQSVIDKGYRDFVGKVAKARGKDFATIHKIAQGRVWSGQQALERGLVDELGGLEVAIADAAKRAKLGEHHPVHYAEPQLGGFEYFIVSLSQGVAAMGVGHWGPRLPGWLAAMPTLPKELGMLRQARAGVPNVYAHCFCGQ